MAQSKLSAFNAEQDLECTICMSDFTEPKLLACLHTFCMTCLKRYCEEIDEEEKPCPLCRTEFIVPEGGVEMLKTDQVKARLVLEEQTKECKQKNIKCDICENANAESFCKECMQCLCSTCTKAHLRVAYTKLHKIVSMDEKPSEAELQKIKSQFCTTHAGEPINLYCCDCEKLLCFFCHATEHNKHMCKVPSEVAKSKCWELKKEQNRVKGCIDDEIKILNDLKTGPISHIEEISKLEKVVEVSFAVMINHLEEQKSKLLTSLRELREEKLKTVNSEGYVSEFRCAELNSFLKYSRMMMERGTYYEILTIANELHKRAENLFQSQKERNRKELQQTNLELLTNISTKIERVKQGICKIDLQISNYQDKSALNPSFLKYEEQPREIKTFPTFDRAFVNMKCPQLICSDLGIRQWFCFNCKAHLQYDFSKLELFCNCGAWKNLTVQYFCKSGLHDSITLSNIELQKLVQVLPKVKTKNILILGETGVGKSLWINTLANFATNYTISEALKDFRSLIPAEFTMADKYGVTKTITEGEFSDVEIRSNKGQSATKYPRSYVFSAGEINIRFIDTPGIGDCGGIVEDKRNCENILTFLSNSKLKELHGICILLKASEARLKQSFIFCIKELFRQLHKSSTSNLVFCYTHARSVFFEPGDTQTSKPLQELLEQIEIDREVKIPYSDNNTFYLDNESFIYLCAMKHGIEISPSKEKCFEESWEKSRDQTVRLLKYISTREPYDIKNSICINEARNLIESLIKPMADMHANINKNIKELEYKLQKISKVSDGNSNLGIYENKKSAVAIPDDLGIPVQLTNLKIIPFPNTKIACESCTITLTDSKTNIISKQYKICEDKPGFLKLLWRLLFQNNCQIYGCKRSSHKEVQYEIVEENYMKTLSNIKELIKSQSGMMDCSNRIAEITVYFIEFVSRNALVAVNDATLEYISVQETLLNEEKITEVNRKDHDARVKSLDQLKINYKKEKKNLNIQSRKNCQDSTKEDYNNPEKVYSLKDELYSMENIGVTLQEMVNATVNARANAFISEEIVFNEHHKSDGGIYSKGIAKMFSVLILDH